MLDMPLLKMYKFLLIIIFFNNYLFGYDTLEFSKEINEKQIKNYLYCINDADNSLTFEKLLSMKDLKKISKTSLGYKYNNYWCRLDIINNSKNTVKKIFSNPRSGMDFIEINLYKNQTIKTYHLGDMLNPTNRSYQSVFSNFEVELEAKESATLLIRYKTLGTLEIGWRILDIKKFIEYENKSNIFMFMFLGFVFAMMIYKSFIYFHIKDKEYLIYALMMFSVLVSESSVRGIVHLYLFDYIDTFTITLASWVFIHLFLVLLWTFTYYFFNVDKKSKFYYILKFVIFYNIFITLLYASAYISTDILQITPLVSLVAFFESIFLLIISFVMFIKRKAGAGYFLIGHFIYIIAVVYYIMMLNGYVEVSFLNTHSAAIGIFAVILFISLSLSKKFKYLKDENKKIQKQIENNKQYTMIGTTISYIFHQWKQPLSILSSQTSLLLTKIDHTPNEKIITIKDKVLSLENSILHINETLENIKKVFTLKNSEESFSFLECIEKIDKNFSQVLVKNNIIFKYDSKNNFIIFGNKNLFINAISNIIENSIESFETTQDNKEIFLKIKSVENKKLLISIKDNAGGIKFKNILDIFNPAVTTKDYGTGIGLAFTKNIIESKFDGSIEAKNIDNGVEFKLIIKKEPTN